MPRKRTNGKPSPNPRSAVEPLRLRGFDGLVLLCDPHVQQELHLSASQRRAIAQTADGFLEDLRPLVEFSRGLQQLSKPEQAVRWSSMNARRVQAAHKRTTEATANLTKSQRRRLNQIALQLRVEEAFYEADVASFLALDESQLRRITARRERLLQDARAAFRHAGQRANGVSLNSTVLDLRREALEEYETLLVPEQSRRLDQLRGPGIAFTKNDINWELRQ